MGPHSPALAAGLVTTAVLFGLTQVGVPAPQAVSKTGDLPRTAQAVPAVAAVDGTALRTSVAKRVSGRSTCRAGLIALTFDDGPSPRVTAKLVRTLVKLKVPATFFMIGSRVDDHPEIARLVQRSGFTIGNHTWDHPQLTHLSNAEIRHELRATTAVFKRHHIKASRLMRPPFGDQNRRVRHVVRELGMIPVLWTIDSRDWEGGYSDDIADRILDGLRPHRTNLVLQHDGVANSPASVAAVPIVVRKARKRGYCFTRLNWAGGVGGGNSPRTAREIVPTSAHTGRESTSTAIQSVSTSTGVTAGRLSTVEVPFSSRASARMSRAAYLRQVLIRLPLRQP